MQLLEQVSDKQLNPLELVTKNLVEEGAAGAWGEAALLISRGPVCFRNKLPVFAEQPGCHCSFQSLVHRSPNPAQPL